MTGPGRPAGGEPLAPMYEARLQEDLSDISTRVAGVSARVREGVHNAIEAVVNDDKRLANVTIINDRAVNRETRQLDHLCHAFVVRHLPVAGHLRRISAVLRVNVALERVGDYAVTICREAVRLRAPLPERLLRDVRLLGREVERILGESIRAFTETSAEVARNTLALAQGVDDVYWTSYEDLVAAAERGEFPVRESFPVLVVLRALKRVADQGANLCHHALFAATGETREHKFYRIQFVDETNDCLSQLAEAFANKAYGQHGHFTSGGWAPAADVRSELTPFLQRLGIEAAGLRPKPLGAVDDQGRHYHIIIGLNSDPRPHLPEVPFRTALLEWAVRTPGTHDDADIQQIMEEAYKNLAYELAQLMDTLEGSDAD